MEEQQETSQLYTALSSAAEQNPRDPRIQEQILQIARQEEGTEKARSGFYGMVPLEELENLFGRMKNAKTLADHYRLMTEKCSTGDLWYDVIIGQRYKDSISALGEFVGKKRWERGLDLGCGTGNVSQEISKYCKTCVGLDLLPFLLKIARDKTRQQKTEFVAANAAHLPFRKGEFDLAVSNAMVVFLSKDELFQFITEIHRVLRPGGSYFEPLGVKSKPVESGKELLVKLIDEMMPPSRREFGHSPESFRMLLAGFRELGFTSFLHQRQQVGAAVLELAKSRPTR